MTRPLTLATLFVLAPLAAQAACASDDEIAAFVTSFTDKTPAMALGADGDMQDALCTQAKLATALSDKMGPVIGYKAGLTAKPAMERFGVTEPVMGVLYRDMMLDNGAEVPADFGAIPLFEADLLLEIGKAGVTADMSPQEVMEHVSAVIPFMELPDLMLAKGQPMTGETITAMGVGARMGIMGDRIAVGDAAALTQALENMTVTVRSAGGEVMAEAPGKAVLGHPANAVTWLVSKGIVLVPGDLVSVGSIGPLLPPAKAGGGAEITYAGLPGDPKVTVTFTE